MPHFLVFLFFSNMTKSKSSCGCLYAAAHSKTVSKQNRNPMGKKINAKTVAIKQVPSESIQNITNPVASSRSQLHRVLKQCIANPNPPGSNSTKVPSLCKAYAPNMQVINPPKSTTPVVK